MTTENVAVTCYDAFISYAHQDAERVKPLVAALRDRGLTVWFDESHIDDFTSITRSLTEGLSRAKVLLAFYSSTYPTRPACQWELTAAFVAARNEGEASRRVLVVNPETGSSHVHPVALRDALFRRAPDDGDVAATAGLAESIAAHVARVENVIGDIRALEQPTWYGTKAVGSSRFVGRVQELWLMDSALHAADFPVITDARGRTVAQVRGLAGVGKTLLVEEYALRFGTAFPGGVFWLRAYGTEHGWKDEEREAQRQTQIRDLAQSVGLPLEGHSFRSSEDALSHWIGSRGLKCLWVVDDLPAGLDVRKFQRWLAPHALAKTLVTTRSGEYESLAPSINLGVLTTDDAYALLTAKRRPQGDAEERAARGIVSDLGNHPLAVEVVGAALSLTEGLQTYAEYRTGLAQQDKDTLEFAAALAPTLPTGHEKSIASSLLRSVDQLPGEGLDFMRLAATLADAPILDALVKDVFRQADDLADPAALERAMLALAQSESRSLAERTEIRKGAHRVHPLVCRTVRFHDSNPGRRHNLRNAAVEIISAPLPAPEEPFTKTEIVFELAHARELAREPTTFSEAKILGWVARADFEGGDYISAHGLFERQHSALQQLRGDGDIATLNARNNLAEALRMRGDLAAAEVLHQTTLTADRQRLGNEHPYTISSMINLAKVRADRGDLSGALELQEEVLQLSTRLFGAATVQTIGAMLELAQTRAKLGDVEQASRLQEQVLKLSRQVLGSDHDYVQQALNDLAFSKRQMGQFVEARQLLEQAYEAKSRLRGENHPDTLSTLENLAATLWSERDFAKAYDIQARVLEVYRRLFGNDNPKTLHAISNLAATLMQSGNPSGARQLLEPLVNSLRHVKGLEHDETTVSAWNLFLALDELGDRKSAGAVLSNYLMWLLQREASSVSGFQRQIRRIVAQVTGRHVEG